ncbi:MAG: aminopeptidase [Oscillospiraceae bacterium]|nr:aminopeptidase [Oscillospiraceae bacterium]
MKTRRLTTQIGEAADILRRGGLVAVPTETVYGLAGNGLDPEVIREIYEVKGRPAVKPISLMVPGAAAISRLCREVPPAALRLAERFWPGPLTLVLKAEENIPEILRAGGMTVGLRCPRQEQTLELLKKLDFPLGVPSANPSGKPSPVTAEEVLGYFDGKIDAVIDGGACALGQASTVLDMSTRPYRILRQGSLPEKAIAEALEESLTLIGITGPTGSGKTTVLQMLEERGALVLDADGVYHELLETSPDLIGELSRAFPGTVRDGRLDRRAMAGQVFQDPAALERLNGITHRYVTDEIRRRLQAFAMEGGTLAAVDAVALFESELSSRCDLTLAVTAPEETRAARIMARDGLTREEALLRIRAQHPDSWFTERCDAAIVNEGEPETLRNQLTIILKGVFHLEDMRETLFFEPQNGYDRLNAEERMQLEDYCSGYMEFLNEARIEREAVRLAVREAEAAGFRPFDPAAALEPGDRVYRVNRGKALMLAVIGKKSLAEGAVIAGAHIDAPRLDLKQIPLYEQDELCYLRTHYYGGIKKYQWVTIPLELHGTVALKSGETVDIALGREKDEPKFVITDLLPHLAQDQMKKTMSEGITGEGLHILIGSVPYADKGKDRVKLAVLSLLNDAYGIREEDFLSAELAAVPAFDVCEVGVDRSMIGGYGHDDRVCAYAELRAILDVKEPEKTCVCILADKEETGSDGVTGMQSAAFDTFMEDLCASQGVKLRRCYEKSFCLSADVTAAFDPLYPEVSEKRSESKLNYGMGICKFTGARGKAGTSDASAELVGRLRALFDRAGVVWQLSELGKVDQGGGGTIAKYMANRNIDTIDAGVPVLSMHAPFEVVGKFDCYMTYKGILAAYEEK